jgi:hypothetical protein
MATVNLFGELSLESTQAEVKTLLTSVDTKMSHAYDATDDMYKVKSMQQKFRDSFPGSTVDATKWDTALGTGQTATVSTGVLTMGSGTTINATSSLLSKTVFTVPFRLSFNLGLSQRIANQTFYAEMISVDPVTQVPNGLHSCGFVYDGTTVTQAKYSVQNSGITPLVSAAVTVPTTAGSVSLYEVEPFCDEVWFHGKVLDSATQRSNSYVRHQQIPDPNAVYKIRLRWLNGSTAPASNTNATLQFVACQDYAELTAEITAGRGQSVAGQGVGVYVTGGLALATQAVSGTVTANIGSCAPTLYADTTTVLAASASYTGTSRDGGATPAFQSFVARAFSDQAGTLYIDDSTDGTTWRRVQSIAVTANECKTLDVACLARYYRVYYTNGTVLQTIFRITSGYKRV